MIFLPIPSHISPVYYFLTVFLPFFLICAFDLLVSLLLIPACSKHVLSVSCLSPCPRLFRVCVGVCDISLFLLSIRLYLCVEASVCHSPSGLASPFLLSLSLSLWLSLSRPLSLSRSTVRHSNQPHHCHHPFAFIVHDRAPLPLCPCCARFPYLSLSLSPFPAALTIPITTNTASHPLQLVFYFSSIFFYTVVQPPFSVFFLSCVRLLRLLPR